jgi:hypothetical protein
VTPAAHLGCLAGSRRMAAPAEAWMGVSGAIVAGRAYS